MRLLLDTSSWLWMEGAPERLGPGVAELLASRETELLVSVASCWEVTIKNAIGKLPLPAPVEHFIPARLAAQDIAVVDIRLEHALGVTRLPLHHRDPFDRIIVAQALSMGVPVLSGDRVLERYPVTVLRADRPYEARP